MVEFIRDFLQKIKAYQDWRPCGEWFHCGSWLAAVLCSCWCPRWWQSHLYSQTPAVSLLDLDRWCSPVCGCWIGHHADGKTCLNDNVWSFGAFDIQYFKVTWSLVSLLVVCLPSWKKLFSCLHHWKVREAKPHDSPQNHVPTQPVTQTGISCDQRSWQKGTARPAIKEMPSLSQLTPETIREKCCHKYKYFNLDSGIPGSCVQMLLKPTHCTDGVIMTHQSVLPSAVWDGVEVTGR